MRKPKVPRPQQKHGKVEPLTATQVLRFPSEAERDLRRWLNRIKREVALAVEELAELKKEL